MDRIKQHQHWIMGDAHVHIHPAFDPDNFFHASAENFHRYRQILPPGSQTCSFLLLTESAGTDMFARFRDNTPVLSCATIMQTKENNVLSIAGHQGDPPLFVVAGRQIVVKEGLEVLALGWNGAFADGLPLKEVLDLLEEKKIPAVLPWGAGKWWGRRGKYVKQEIEERTSPLFFLGDNANRPFFWPRSQLFSQAGERGIRNLQGSDPLPFPGQENKMASFGFYCPGKVDFDRPFQSLVSILSDRNIEIGSYGTPERIFPFFYHQISMQLSRKSR